jgi:hypothetical protein
MNYEPGDLVGLKNPDSVHKDKKLVVILKLQPEADDDYTQSGPNYLLRTHDQRKLTAYACELFLVARNTATALS